MSLLIISNFQIIFRTPRLILIGNENPKFINFLSITFSFCLGSKIFYYIVCIPLFAPKAPLRYLADIFWRKTKCHVAYYSFVCHAILFEKPTQFSCCSMLLLQPALGQFIVTSPSSKHHSAVQLCTIVHRISVYLSLYLSYLFALTQIVVVVVQRVKALDFSKVLLY